MADILIHMEMPETCGDCPLSALRMDCKLTGRDISHDWMKRKIPDWCPLVPLPEGHGRLGDLEIAEAILHNKAFDLAGTSGEYNALRWALRQIKALPTIVPSEGGGEDG